MDASFDASQVLPISRRSSVLGSQLPKASLSSLPRETKARIVQLARLQDDRYHERWPKSNNKAMIEAVKTKWHGRSLAALSETCKDLNTLASRHLFQTISLKLIDQSYFFLVILPRHAESVRVAKFTGFAASDPERLVRALGTLQLLPRLEELHLDQNISQRLWGLFGKDGDASDSARIPPSTQLCRQVLRRLAPKITSLHLLNYDSLEASALIQQFLNLRAITLKDITQTPPSAIVPYTLANMARLERLSVESVLAAGFTIGPEWALETWLCPLRSLSLRNVPLCPDTLAFIDGFSSTLEQLTFKGTSPSPPTGPQPDSIPHPFLPSPFPLLKSFSIQCAPHILYKGFIDSFARLHLPVPRLDAAPLLSLDVNLSSRKDAGINHNDYRQLGSRFPTLRHLCVLSQDLPLRGLSRELVQTCLDCGVTLAFESREDPFLQRASVRLLREVPKEDLYEKRMAARHLALKQTLNFGHQRVDRMLEYDAKKANTVLHKQILAPRLRSLENRSTINTPHRSRKTLGDPYPSLSAIHLNMLGQVSRGPRENSTKTDLSRNIAIGDVADTDSEYVDLFELKSEASDESKSSDPSPVVPGFPLPDHALAVFGSHLRLSDAEMNVVKLAIKGREWLYTLFTTGSLQIRLSRGKTETPTQSIRIFLIDPLDMCKIDKRVDGYHTFVMQEWLSATTLFFEGVTFRLRNMYEIFDGKHPGLRERLGVEVFENDGEKFFDVVATDARAFFYEGRLTLCHANLATGRKAWSEIALSD
ncbi:hypothetical protein P7C70_g7724, partial [Phenoliferia sp. Uapishka_3]